MYTLMDCSICLEIILPDTSTTTICNHIFHTECLNNWLEIKNSCPLCRTPFYCKNCECCKVNFFINTKCKILLEPYYININSLKFSRNIPYVNIQKFFYKGKYVWFNYKYNNIISSIKFKFCNRSKSELLFENLKKIML